MNVRRAHAHGHLFFWFFSPFFPHFPAPNTGQGDRVTDSVRVAVVVGSDGDADHGRLPVPGGSGETGVRVCVESEELSWRHGKRPRRMASTGAPSAIGVAAFNQSRTARAATAAQQCTNPDATLFVGNLGTGDSAAATAAAATAPPDDPNRERLLAELFTQCGPVRAVRVPRDRINGVPAGNYAFVEFYQRMDADYAARIMDGVRFRGRCMRVQRERVDSAAAGGDSGGLGWRGGAAAVAHGDRDAACFKLHVGNLNADTVDEQVMAAAFRPFGALVEQPVVVRRRQSEGGGDGAHAFGFVKYATREEAEAAVRAMNGRMLGDRPVRVSHARAR